MTTLHALQQDMLTHLLRPSAIAPAWIADLPPLAPSERLAVYANAYFLRLDEALRANFPKLHLLLGDDDFAALSRAYLDAQPSRQRSLRWLGASLPDWLREQAPYANVPALAELAAFEWSLGTAFDASDAPQCGIDALGHIADEAWPSLRPQFHPALRLLKLEWNAPTIWQALERDETPPAPARAEQIWATWRIELTPHYRSLSDDEAAFCLALQQGADFAQACEALLPWHDEDNAPMRAAGLLGTWLGEGWISRVAEPSNASSAG